MISLLHLHGVGYRRIRRHIPLCRRDQTSESATPWHCRGPKLMKHQLALEEMADVFEAPNPKQRSFELARIARERAREQRSSARV